MSLLKKITSGFIDSVKSAKLLLEKEMSELEKEPMSEDCVLLVDENVFAKVSTVLQWQFYKTKWSEIDECLYHLQKAGFYVRAVISDDHASIMLEHSNCYLMIIMEIKTCLFIIKFTMKY